MWWLSFVGPIVVALVYVLTGRPDRRREGELDRWRAQRGAGQKRDVKREETAYRSGKETVTTGSRPGPRRVTSLPGPLARLLEATGGGTRVAYFELYPKLAYLAVMGADPTQGSDHATLLAKLDEAGPSFTVRPLPIEEGVRVPNTGVQFQKDPDFMASFLVEATVVDAPPAPIAEPTAKRIRKWLSPPLREALLEFPDGWLRVDGVAKAMAFTLYGPTSAARIDELIAAADIVFAEYGAGGGPSLLADDDDTEEDATERAPKKKAADAPEAPASKA
jgi:hypothetical protein